MEESSRAVEESSPAVDACFHGICVLFHGFPVVAARGTACSGCCGGSVLAASVRTGRSVGVMWVGRVRFVGRERGLGAF